MSNNRVLGSLKSPNNCSNLNQKFKIDELTKLNDDVCHNSGTLQQNDGINDYMLSNYSSCDCSLGNVLDVSTENRGLTVKDGFGVSECNINKDSELRHGAQKRRNKIDQQLLGLYVKYHDANHVLREGDNLLICREVEDAQIIEDESKIN